MANTWNLSTALACDFAWVTTGADLVLSFPAGASPVTVNVASGSYRILLAPSAREFLAKLNAAIATALAGAGRAETITASMGADGRVVLGCTGGGGLFALNPGDPIPTLLGFTTGGTPAATATATYAPQYVALAVSAYGGLWAPKKPTALAQTAAGQTFGVVSGVNSWARSFKVEFIPIRPAVALDQGTPATPLVPDDQHLVGAQLGTRAPPWTWADFVRAAATGTCGFTQDLQTLRGSFGTYYNVVSIDPAMVGELVAQRADETWEAFAVMALRLTSQDTATETRA